MAFFYELKIENGTMLLIATTRCDHPAADAAGVGLYTGNNGKKCFLGDIYREVKILLIYLYLLVYLTGTNWWNIAS